jgi:hypothetical protein
MMNFGLFKNSVILFAAVAIVLPNIVQATTLGTVDVSTTGFYASDIMQVWAGGYEGAVIRAGVSMIEKTDSTYEGHIWPNGSLGVFCIELTEPTSIDELTYNVLMPENGPEPTTFLGETMGYAKAHYIQELWGRYYDSSWSSGGTFTDTQNRLAAAFSSAIWEIIYEDLPKTPYGWDVTIDGTAGDKGFRTDYDYASLANVMLYSLDGTGPLADLRVFSYDGAQDYLVAVPEPATMALLGLGGVMALLRRRRTAVN